MNNHCHSLRFSYFTECWAFALIWINIKDAKFAAIIRASSFREWLSRWGGRWPP